MASLINSLIAEEKGSNRWCFSKEKRILDSILGILKASELIWLRKSQMLNKSLFPLSFSLPPFCVPVLRVWNQFKHFLRSWMGQCKGNLFPMFRDRTATNFINSVLVADILQHVCLLIQETSICTLSHYPPVYIHSR